jgi:hypothetical protein
MGDARILPGLSFGISNDLLSNFVEVKELLSWKMKEFAPFVWVRVFVARFIGPVNLSCMTNSGHRWEERGKEDTHDHQECQRGG